MSDVRINYEGVGSFCGEFVELYALLIALRAQHSAETGYAIIY